ncbi:MAG: hypothetical protein WCG99_03660 [Candidatus Berkelbacteria bacterium]
MMTMSASITSSRTDDQVRQVTQRFEAAARRGVELALRKVDPDRDGVQRLIEVGAEADEEIIEAILNVVRSHSVTNQFADEETESEYGYLSGYAPKDITTQTNRLRELFTGIGYADEQIAMGELLANAEGWFAIPKWQTMAPTYGEAVQMVLDMIKQTRSNKFYNYCENLLDPAHLRQSAKSEKIWEAIAEQQPNHDIMVVQAQFGLLHRGRSVRRAREVMNANQFGLGAFAVGIMLLTHPERLQNYDDLYVDCAGDEFSSEAAGGFGNAPYFNFSDGGVKFYAYWVGDTYARYGSASGFLPQ